MRGEEGADRPDSVGPGGYRSPGRKGAGVPRGRSGGLGVRGWLLLVVLAIVVLGLLSGLLDRAA